VVVVAVPVEVVEVVELVVVVGSAVVVTAGLVTVVVSSELSPQPRKAAVMISMDTRRSLGVRLMAITGLKC
jgi:hypothetical protein